MYTADQYFEHVHVCLCSLHPESPGDRRSTVLVPGGELSLSSSFQHIEPEQQTDKTEVEEDSTEGMRERVLSPALLNCPALQFITRKDLYLFLNSAGVRSCGVPCMSVCILCMCVHVRVFLSIRACTCGMMCVNDTCTCISIQCTCIFVMVIVLVHACTCIHVPAYMYM